jgi:hypothetical protein
MILKKFLLPLLLAVLPALAGDPPAPTKALNPFDVVGVCPIATKGRAWSVAWHQGIDGPDTATARVFRYLQSPDVDGCLALMVEADQETYEIVETFAKNPTQELGLKASKAVQQRWTLYGVDRAITEVAETGSRGLQVARMLAACEEIKTNHGHSGSGQEMRNP